MKKLAVLTSGGDAPGMNACIRAVVRTALHQNIEVIGFRHGYEGLIHDENIHLTHKSVANIIQRGGTILKTSRSQRFRTEEGLQLAASHLKKHNVEGLVVIGGDGTFTGAIALSAKSDIPIVGCPGTIDNDLVGTDFTIGYDTAINTVIDAVDKIRDTAESHDRVFIVEVMGRDAGLIALRSGIGSGAEAILIPETKNDIKKLIERLKTSRKDKASKIIIVAEGDESGGAYKVAEILKEFFPQFDMRVSILGHMQRGGSPSCMERVNASIMGYNAVQALLQGKQNVMIGIVNKQVVYTPFEKAIKHTQALNADMLKMMEILSI
ncbi:MAG TPA: 6-phosphofructokinase [Bacteroidia bacterium]|nr:6-phosphofructokinase [Bacteroidia bacterium]